jgi:hypothetical protein
MVPPPKLYPTLYGDCSDIQKCCVHQLPRPQTLFSDRFIGHTEDDPGDQRLMTEHSGYIDAKSTHVLYA